MKRNVFGYMLIMGLVAMGLQAFADEIKREPLNDEGYAALIKDFSRGKDCIFSQNINNWSALDRKSLILYAPTKNRPYYVELFTKSTELKFAHRIGVYSKFDNRFCGYGGDALFIEGERMSIRAIKKLNKETAKQMIQYQKDKKKKIAQKVKD